MPVEEPQPRASDVDVSLSDALNSRRLNAYAERVATIMLASQFVEPSATVAIDREGDLTLRFACASQSLENGLSFYTWNDNVIVGFHTGHWHFADWQGDDRDDAHVHDAIELARGLRDERLLLASWHRHGRIVRYSYPMSGDPLASLGASAAEILDRRRIWRLRRRLRLPPPRFRVTLRSCSGRYDDDLDDVSTDGARRAVLGS